MSKRKTRNLVSFYDLSEEWQAEAIRNHNAETAQEQLYFEPNENHNPEEHILFDLSECMRVTGEEYHGVIGLGNSGGIAVKLLDDEQVETWLL